MFECFAPIVLAGIVSTIEVNKSTAQYTDTHGGIVSALSCDTGFGVGMKATTIGLHAIEGHYGFTATIGSVRASLLPKFGVSMTDRYIRELPQAVQFSLGAQALLGYEHMRLSLEYWHASNGEALHLNVSDRPNIGLDLVTVQVGWAF